MDELDISGKRYLSTRRAGRENGYHSDYIGQLIRGSKVAGQKVGRAWYVEEESLNMYLGKQTPRVNEEAQPYIQPTPETQEVLVEQKETPQEFLPPVEEVKEKVQEKIQTKIIEPRIEVKREEPIKIPIKKTGGLTFMPDDSDFLPTVVRTPPVLHRMPKEEEKKYSTYPAPTSPQRATRSVAPVVTLSIIGIFALMVVGAASNLISQKIVVEQGKAASAAYSVGW